MKYKKHRISIRSNRKTMTRGLWISLFLSLTLCFIFAGCSKKSAETQVPSTKKTVPTSVESSITQSPETKREQTQGSDTTMLQGELEITLNYKHVDDIATNQYAVWIEDSSGKFIRTLYVTSFTAKGGWKDRPESLEIWVERSGLSSGSAQKVDAYSGATPKSGTQTYTWDCKDEFGQTTPAGEYHFFVEGTIYWENAVLFEGVIDLGSEETTVQAEASYTTDEAKKSDMITDVSAIFRP